jgi:hypothetical protein
MNIATTSVLLYSFDRGIIFVNNAIKFECNVAPRYAFPRFARNLCVSWRLTEGHFRRKALTCGRSVVLRHTGLHVVSEYTAAVLHADLTRAPVGRPHLGFTPRPLRRWASGGRDEMQSTRQCVSVSPAMSQFDLQLLVKCFENKCDTSCSLMSYGNKPFLPAVLCGFETSYLQFCMGLKALPAVLYGFETSYLQFCMGLKLLTCSFVWAWNFLPAVLYGLETWYLHFCMGLKLLTCSFIWVWNFLLAVSYGFETSYLQFRMGLKLVACSFVWVWNLVSHYMDTN